MRRDTQGVQERPATFREFHTVDGMARAATGWAGGVGAAFGVRLLQRALYREEQAIWMSEGTNHLELVEYLLQYYVKSKELTSSLHLLHPIYIHIAHIQHVTP